LFELGAGRLMLGVGSNSFPSGSTRCRSFGSRLRCMLGYWRRVVNGDPAAVHFVDRRIGGAGTIRVDDSTAALASVNRFRCGNGAEQRQATDAHRPSRDFHAELLAE
jgi:hypothetical protein